MASTIRQLKENISYIQKKLQNLDPEDRAEVFKGDNELQGFIDALDDMYSFISKFEKDRTVSRDLEERYAVQDVCSNFYHKLSAEKSRATHPFDRLQSQSGKLLSKSIRDLVIDIYEFDMAFQLGDKYDHIENSMCRSTADREQGKFRSSVERQKAAPHNSLNKTVQQKNTANEMLELLQSTKSVFVKNSPYFKALEDSLKALKKFTDRLPADQAELNKAQTLKLTELYDNAYQAANAYINRKESYTVRGNRMNMAILLRDALRTGAAAHKGLVMRSKEEEKKAAQNVNAEVQQAEAQNVIVENPKAPEIPNAEGKKEVVKNAGEEKLEGQHKKQLPLNALAEKLGKSDKLPSRRNSIAGDMVPTKHSVTRSNTFAG